jgi:MFS family permease
VLLAVVVATAGVLPGFLTGGLAVQIRGELGFGEGALGFAVAVFFAASALASVVSGRVVERLGPLLGMRLAAAASAASLLAVSVLASSWWRLCACLVLGGLGNAISHPATHLLLAREVPQNRQGLAFGVKQPYRRRPCSPASPYPWSPRPLAGAGPSLGVRRSRSA